MQTASVWSGRNEGNIDYCLCEDLPTLVWLANLADLELHTPMARAPEIDQPTMIAFDLDPGPPADDRGVRARWRWSCGGRSSILGPAGVPEDVGLEGHAGLPAAEHAGDLRGHARVLARAWRRCSSGATPTHRVDMSKSRRAGKVFVDWSQNDRHKTTVNVYSLRAMERPTVSTPLTWDEVSDIADGRRRWRLLRRGA